MRVRLSNEYLNLKFNYCNKKLAALPKISKGFHRGIPVFWIKQFSEDGKYKLKEIRYTSKKAPRLGEIEILRKKLTEEITALQHTNGVDPQNALRLKSSNKSNLNGAFYKQLTGESNMQKNTSKYVHKGIHMRSRAELIVAEVLDELHLQYKYEPGIDINGTTYYPDFVVYIEAIDSCFIIEVLGLTDDPEYMFNNANKLVTYAGAGIYINSNLLLIGSTGNYVPDTDDIYNSVVNMVNLATWHALE